MACKQLASFGAAASEEAFGGVVGVTEASRPAGAEIARDAVLRFADLDG